MARKWFAGMKKEESPLGEFMERHGLGNQDLVKAGGPSRNTISALRKKGAASPTRETALRIVKALSTLTGKSVKITDLF